VIFRLRFFLRKKAGTDDKVPALIDSDIPELTYDD